MSTFGQHLLRKLYDKKCDIFIADKDESIITDNMAYAVTAKIADCTNELVLKSFGPNEFDCCFVCLGGNFTESLEITYLLKELGAKKVITEVNRDIEKKFLLRNGADDVIYPEEDMAIRIAEQESSDSIVSFIEISDGYSIFEISVPDSWIGKSLLSLRIREKYSINIIAIKKNGLITAVISPETVFTSDMHIIVMCHQKDIKKFIK